MKNLRPWLSAMRLRTLPLSVSGAIVSACFAYYNGHFNPWVFTLALLTTISLQILSNLANDYGDGVRGTDNAERVGPKRAIQSGVITPKQMLEAIQTNIVITIIFSMLLIWIAFGTYSILYVLLFIGLGALCVYAAMTYTMGDKPYGYRALGDVFVFVFFGLVSVLANYFLHARTLDHVVVLPAIALGLLSVGVLNLNNMRDAKQDAQVGKVTLAVKLGAKRSKIYHYCLVVGAMIIALLFDLLYYVSPYNLLNLIAFIPLSIHLVKIKNAKTPKDFDKQLKVLALSTFLFAVLLGIGYILY